jgi:hypothetical protein
MKHRILTKKYDKTEIKITYIKSMKYSEGDDERQLITRGKFKTKLIFPCTFLIRLAGITSKSSVG